MELCQFKVLFLWFRVLYFFFSAEGITQKSIQIKMKIDIAMYAFPKDIQYRSAVMIAM